MKKSFLTILVITIIFLLGCITSYIDNGRVSTNNEPKFCIKTTSFDCRKVTYFGLGYKVIRYVGVSPNEPYKSNIGVKFGSWFMKYELPKENVKIIDEIYDSKPIDYVDIRSLSMQYSIFDAQKDNCFVIGAMVHNDYLYTEFMDNYKNKKDAFIRIAKNTIEGDLILYDIMYNESLNQLLLVTDLTRDKFSSIDDRKISFKEYENIDTYKYKEKLYWVIYNGTLNDETFNKDNVFVLAVIN
ncbi:MAG: DUF4362 domain-containing protein [Clostridia bacterium]